MKYFIAFIAVSLFFACGKEKPKGVNESNGDKAIPVRLANIENENIGLSIQASGVVTSKNEAKPAFKTGGVVAKMYVEEGDFVKSGQLLASLDLTEISAQVNQAQEAVAKAERDLERAQNLYADSVATLENVQDAQTGLNVAKQNLQMASFNKNFSEIRAPIAGKVVKKLVNTGEIVGPGIPAYYLLGNASSDWVINAGLSDRDWARVAVGDPVTIVLDAYPGKEFSANITDIADTANPGSGTFDVEISLKERPKRLAAGLIASVEIHPKEAGKQLLIPLDALVETNKTDAKIFVVKNNVAESKPVKIAYLYHDKVVISSGLENVEAVVTDGAPYLFDGAKVEIIK